MMQNDGAGFLSGAAGGFFGSLGATAWGGAGGKWGGIAGKYAGSDVGTIAFGALSGGVGAELSGGNFWQGAIAGGIVAGLNHVMHKISFDDEIDPPGKKSKKQVRNDTLKPSAAKMVEVEGNVLGVSDLVMDSRVGNFVRGGAPRLSSVSKVLKVGGNTLGIVGIGFEAAEVLNGNMSYTEFGVDTVIGGAAIVTSIFAAPVVATGFAVGSLVYFGGKAIYEYSSGKTLFTKPNK